MLAVGLFGCLTTEVGDGVPPGSRQPMPDASAAAPVGALPDSGSGSGGGGGGAAQPGDAAGGAVDCDDLVAANGDGHHNPGLACLNCHGGIGLAPTFTLGGTLYKDLNGGAPLAGATIRVTDGAGQSVKIVTAANGNFYSTQALTFPLTVAASACPDTVPMMAQVQQGQGSCNAANCHDADMRINLPTGQ
jgi:hypothetical protein